MAAGGAEDTRPLPWHLGPETQLLCWEVRSREVGFPEPRCAPLGEAGRLGPGPHPATRRGPGDAVMALCRALSSWRSWNSAVTQPVGPARPRSRGTRGNSDEQVPVLGVEGSTLVLHLHPLQPPAGRVRLTHKAPRCLWKPRGPVARREAGFNPGVRSPLPSVPARHPEAHLRRARGAPAPAPAHYPRVCAQALGGRQPPAPGGRGCSGDFSFGGLREIKPQLGLHQHEPALSELDRWGSPLQPDSEEVSSSAHQVFPRHPARKPLRESARERRPAEQVRARPRPGVGAAAGARTASGPRGPRWQMTARGPWGRC